MNVRFAETCQNNPLQLDDLEKKIANQSTEDGVTKQYRLLNGCTQDIYLGVFFDGTNNNKYRDTPGYCQSNVARLYEAFPGYVAGQTPPKLKDKVVNGSKRPAPVHPDEDYWPTSFKQDSNKNIERPYYRKIYVPGVGTPMPDVFDTGDGVDKMLGLAMALHGQARLDWAMLQVCNQIHAVITATQESPGGAPIEPFVRDQINEARRKQFLKELDEQLAKPVRERAELPDLETLPRYERALREAIKKRIKDRPKPALRKIRLSIYGFSRGAAQARAWVNMVDKRWGSSLAGIPLQIDFLGIFDTVASVGLAQAAPGANGHFAWADGENMVVPASVKRCTHLVSAHEQRGSFPLDSVCTKGVLPPNCKEIVYPGVHSDVGGGYSPNNQGRARGNGADGDKLKISQISLAQMYREAVMAGVPLPDPQTLDTDQIKGFDINPGLIRAFNAYVEATRTYTVPPTNGQGDPQFARMFPTEIQPRSSTANIIRTHAGHLLRWRKAMMEGVGAANLPHLKNPATPSDAQDVKDIQDAEEELRKELAFLNNPNEKEKYATLDDPLDIALNNPADLGIRILSPVIGAAVAVGRIGFLQLMRDKQHQWDSYLKNEWCLPAQRALPADKLAATHYLYEHHVHDSRSWFKPLLRADMSMAPNDDEWFDQGDRDKEIKQRLNKLDSTIAGLEERLLGLRRLTPAETQRRRSRLAEKRRAGTEADLAKREQALIDQSPEIVAADETKKYRAELNQKYHAELDAAYVEREQLKSQDTLIGTGGREPYKAWGYIRHRRVYESGSYNAEVVTPRQEGIEAEERARELERRRKQMLEEEDKAHALEKEKINDDAKRKRDDTTRSPKDRDEHADAARARYQREEKRHQEAVKRIHEMNKVPTKNA